MLTEKCLVVNVTQDDIDWAIEHDGRGSVSYCPVARAIARHEGYQDVEVGGDYVEFVHGNYNYEAKSSHSLRLFIDRFDSIGRAKPTKFRLRLKHRVYVNPWLTRIHL